MPVLTHRGQISKNNRDVIIGSSTENTKIKFKNPSGNNVTWNFPTALGTTGQVLQITSTVRDSPIDNSSLTNVNNLILGCRRWWWWRRWWFKHFI